MKYFLLLLLLVPHGIAATQESIAAHLAKEAEQANGAGQIVRAYMLYAEAAVRDPKQVSYAERRDELAAAAHLLAESNVQSADIQADVKAAESQSGNATVANPFDALSSDKGPQVQPLPHVEPSSSVQDFDLRVQQKEAISSVAQAFGIQVIFDPDFDDAPLGRFTIEHVDFKTAMEAITAVTHTFVFPVSSHRIFVARDTDTKRNEYEPEIVATIPLPDAVEQKEIVEAATAVRGALALRSVSWDDVARTVSIRDHPIRAHVAASLFSALLLPKAQLSFEVQILAVDSNTHYHYGLALPTSFAQYTFAQLGALQTAFPDLTNAGALFAFGAGRSFFGLALGSGTLFAQYSKSVSRVLYDATVVVGDRQTANVHVGDKYPIPQALYSGFQQTGANGSVYNPIGQVTLEDLGIVLKMTPHVNGRGEVALDIEAQYKALGTQSFNTVPSIAQREFKGSVRLREDQFAIIAGLNEDDHSVTRSGIAGLASIPGIDEVLAENNRDHTTSNTVILIKPTITRLPISDTVVAQYLLGGHRGPRVLL